ncbi:MAG: hypothetical protein HON94_08465, partial [Methylococcales bacterium]|nr:hypothetical protein [Methylococcales bacterium]
MSLLCETLIVNHQLMASIFINLSIKHKNNNELSLSLINKALQLEPSNSQAIVQKSQLLLNQGNVYDAFEIFQEVFVSEPDNFQLIQQFSILCLIIPFFCDKGIEIVEHGLTVYLNDFVLTRQLAKLCARRLYFKKSSNYYQSLEELNAKRLGLSGRLGYALVEQKLGSHQNAKRLINEAIKLSDDNTKQFLVQNDQVQAVRSQAMKGHLQIVSNDFETARSTFSQLSNKQASINYDIDRYRHDTEIKINQLADITAHRDIAILAHGPSLYQFEEKLDQFKLIDLCYWGMERFRITETNIVQPLNTHHHVIMVTVAQFMNNMASMLIDYLQQSEKNVLITSIEAMNALKKPNLCRAEMENKFGDQIIYFTNDIGSPASPVDPCNLLGGNVLSMMIPFACLAK